MSVAGEAGILGPQGAAEANKKETNFRLLRIEAVVQSSSSKHY